MKIFGDLKILDKDEDQKEKMFSSIKTNSIDNYAYTQALQSSLSAAENISKMNKDQPFFDKLNQDLFNGLYKVQPELCHKENVYKSLEMENDLSRELMNNESFNKLREFTVSDDFLTMYSMKSFQEKAYYVMKEWEKENKESLDDINSAIKEQNHLQNLLDLLEDNPDNKSLQDQINEQQKKVNQKNNSVQEHGQAASRLTDELKEKLKDAGNDCEKMKDCLDNFNFGGDARSRKIKVTDKDREALVEAFSKSKKIRNISKHLGRLKDSLSKVGNKPSRRGSEVSDIGTGNNINKIFSSEKTKLIDKDLETDFFKRYLDKELLELKTKGSERNKGPVVMCIDASGSMSGSKNTWSISIAIALLQIAQKENRAYRVIFFNSYVDEDDIIDFEPRECNTEGLLNVLERGASGGTNFERPLECALDSILTSEFKNADILFLTDGEPSRELSEEFLERFTRAKKDKGFFVQSITIGCDNDYYLNEFSDSIITLQDLNKDDDVINALRNIRDKS